MKSMMCAGKTVPPSSANSAPENSPSDSASMPSDCNSILGNRSNVIGKLCACSRNGGGSSANVASISLSVRLFNRSQSGFTPLFCTLNIQSANYLFITMASYFCKRHWFYLRSDGYATRNKMFEFDLSTFFQPHFFYLCSPCVFPATIIHTKHQNAICYFVQNLKSLCLAVCARSSVG